jgi:hypothetical protein
VICGKRKENNAKTAIPPSSKEQSAQQQRLTQAKNQRKKVTDTAKYGTLLTVL